MPLLPGDVPSRQGIQDAIDEVYNDLDNRINQMDSGWVALTLNSAWSGSAQYRVINNVVYLNGSVSRASGNETTIATVPSSIRPLYSYTATVRLNSPFGMVPFAVSAADGAMRIANAQYTNGGTLPLSSAGPYPLG